MMKNIYRFYQIARCVTISMTTHIVALLSRAVFLLQYLREFKSTNQLLRVKKATMYVRLSCLNF